jgi:RNA polymerase sigma-70 factor (ECF subfamily)
MSDARILPLPGRRPPADAYASRADDELMRLVRVGERGAFAALMTRHHARLGDVCVKLTGSRAIGDELAQETWLRVWAHRADYRASGQFDGFLFTIARNLVKNHLRGARRRGRVVADADGEATAAALEGTHLDALLARERQAYALEALASLPGPLREALVLRFAAGLDYAQMGAIAGASESTLRSRVFHGLRRLRARLDGAR